MAFNEIAVGSRGTLLLCSSDCTLNEKHLFANHESIGFLCVDIKSQYIQSNRIASRHSLSPMGNANTTALAASALAASAAASNSRDQVTSGGNLVLYLDEPANDNPHLLESSYAKEYMTMGCADPRYLLVLKKTRISDAVYTLMSGSTLDETNNPNLCDESTLLKCSLKYCQKFFRKNKGIILNFSCLHICCPEHFLLTNRSNSAVEVDELTEKMLGMTRQGCRGSESCIKALMLLSKIKSSINDSDAAFAIKSDFKCLACAKDWWATVPSDSDRSPFKSYAIQIESHLADILSNVSIEQTANSAYISAYRAIGLLLKSDLEPSSSSSLLLEKPVVVATRGGIEGGGGGGGGDYSGHILKPLSPPNQGSQRPNFGHRNLKSRSPDTDNNGTISDIAGNIDDDISCMFCEPVYSEILEAGFTNIDEVTQRISALENENKRLTAGRNFDKIDNADAYMQIASNASILDILYDLRGRYNEIHIKKLSFLPKASSSSSSSSDPAHQSTSNFSSSSNFIASSYARASANDHNAESGTGLGKYEEEEEVEEVEETLGDFGTSIRRLLSDSSNLIFDAVAGNNEENEGESNFDILLALSCISVACKKKRISSIEKEVMKDAILNKTKEGFRADILEKLKNQEEREILVKISQKFNIVSDEDTIGVLKSTRDNTPSSSFSFSSSILDPLGAANNSNFRTNNSNNNPLLPILDPVALPILDPVALPILDPVALPISDPVALPILDPAALPISDPSATSAVIATTITSTITTFTTITTTTTNAAAVTTFTATATDVTTFTTTALQTAAFISETNDLKCCLCEEIYFDSERGGFRCNENHFTCGSCVASVIQLIALGVVHASNCASCIIGINKRSGSSVGQFERNHKPKQVSTVSASDSDSDSGVPASGASYTSVAKGCSSEGGKGCSSEGGKVTDESTEAMENSKPRPGLFGTCDESYIDIRVHKLKDLFISPNPTISDVLGMNCKELDLSDLYSGTYSTITASNRASLANWSQIVDALIRSQCVVSSVPVAICNTDSSSRGLLSEYTKDRISGTSYFEKLREHWDKISRSALQTERCIEVQLSDVVARKNSQFAVIDYDIDSEAGPSVETCRPNLLLDNRHEYMNRSISQISFGISQLYCTATSVPSDFRTYDHIRQSRYKTNTFKEMIEYLNENQDVDCHLNKPQWQYKSIYQTSYCSSTLTPVVPLSEIRRIAVANCQRAAAASFILDSDFYLDLGKEFRRLQRSLHRSGKYIAMKVNMQRDMDKLKRNPWDRALNVFKTFALANYISNEKFKKLVTGMISLL